jgi:hypothetical protein
VSRSFFAINISSFPFREGLAQAQFCIDGTAGPPCLAALSGQPPEPGGSRRKARGVDGESACRATMVSGHYAANVTALSVLFDPLFPLKFRLRLFNRSKAEPLLLLRHSPHQTYIRSGQAPVPRSLLQQCEGTGLQGRMGPFCIAASFSHAEYRSHIQPWNWNQLEFPSSSFGDPHFTFRMAPSGTRPFSR